MHLDVWCCNSHGDLAKILEKTCHARSPCKENFRNWKHFLPLVGMYLHKELIIAMKVIIIFKEDFTEFCNANYILTVYPQIHGLHFSSDKLIFLGWLHCI